MTYSQKLCLLAVAAIVSPCTWAVTVELPAALDNTIFDESQNSNGLGDDLISGKTGTFNDPSFSERRALIQFDLTGIPPGSQIESVDLLLSVNKAVTPELPFTVHRLTKAWGEGASVASGEKVGTGAPAQPGDATWARAFFDSVSWETPGGDFIASPSATQSVAGFADYAWTGPGMIADVQLWVNSPESNFGWILLGPQDPFVKSAKRFSSRESDFNPPALVVTYAEGFGLWASYPVNEDGRSVFTNGFLGWIDISSAPWIYVYALNKFIYAPEENISLSGGWVWIGQ